MNQKRKTVTQTDHTTQSDDAMPIVKHTQHKTM